MGHVIAMWQKGMKTSAPVFIPFLGAAIFAPMTGVDRETEAYVGYGGPLLGSIGGIVNVAALRSPYYEDIHVIGGRALLPLQEACGPRAKYQDLLGIG